MFKFVRVYKSEYLKYVYCYFHHVRTAQFPNLGCVCVFIYTVYVGKTSGNDSLKSRYLNCCKLENGTQNQKMQ